MIHLQGNQIWTLSVSACMRLACIALVVLAASCASADPQTSGTDGSSVSTSESNGDPTTSTSTATTVLTTVALPAEFVGCQGDLPLFATGEVFAAGRYERAEATGAEGPGAGSTPAEPHQTVRHWADEFGTYEVRWPGSDVSDAESRDLGFFAPNDGLVAGYQARYFRMSESKFAIELDIPERASPCDLLTFEFYGEKPDAVEENGLNFVSSLLPQSEFDNYMAELLPTLTLSDLGSDLDPGQCAQPYLLSGDRVSLADSVEFVGRFIADRAAGDRAHACLTQSAVESFDGVSGSEFEPPLCLFHCDGRSLPVSFGPIQGGGMSEGQLVSVVVTHEPDLVLREEYEVVAVPGESGDLVLAIQSVRSEPESWVSFEAAQLRVTEFLQLLAAKDYEATSPYLFNEGISQTVMDALQMTYDEMDEFSARLETYCESAHCNSAFEVTGMGGAGRYYREVVVRFDDRIGETFRVGMFEGQLTLGSLPPLLD